MCGLVLGYGLFNKLYIRDICHSVILKVKSEGTEVQLENTRHCPLYIAEQRT